MNVQGPLIDEIVRRVLSQLGTERAPAPPAPAAVAAASTAPPLVSLDQAIVTQEVLEQSIGSAIRVRISPRAIVTPSARDFIRQRRIEIVRDIAESKAAPRSRTRLFVTAASPHLAAALEGLRSGGIACERTILGTAAEAAAESISALCRAEVDSAVIVCSEPELAACLANRNARVRAASLTALAALAAIRATLQPNLIAFNPAGKSQFELKQLLQELLKG